MTLRTSQILEQQRDALNAQIAAAQLAETKAKKVAKVTKITRTVRTAEEKASILIPILSGKSIATVSQETGIAKSVLNRWRNAVIGGLTDRRIKAA